MIQHLFTRGDRQAVLTDLGDATTRPGPGGRWEIEMCERLGPATLEYTNDIGHADRIIKGYLGILTPVGSVVGRLSMDVTVTYRVDMPCFIRDDQPLLTSIEEARQKVNLDSLRRMIPNRDHGAHVQGKWDRLVVDVP